MHSMQLLSLRSALNEKDLDLIELREQHVALVVRRKQGSRLNGHMPMPIGCMSDKMY